MLENILFAILLDDDEIKLLVKTLIKMLFGPILLVINCIFCPDKNYIFDCLLEPILSRSQLNEDTKGWISVLVFIIYIGYMIYSTFLVPVHFCEELKNISLASGSRGLTVLIPGWNGNFSDYSTSYVLAIMLIAAQLGIKLLFFLIKWVMCVVVLALTILRLVITGVYFLIEFIADKVKEFYSK